VLKAARVERISADRKIGDLAGRAASPADDPALGDEAHPDSGSKSDEGEGARVTTAALPQLALSGHVDVVLDRDLKAEPFLEGAYDIELIETGDIGRVGDDARPGLEDTGASHDTQSHCAQGEFPLLRDPPEKGADMVDDETAAARIGRFQGVAEDRSHQVRERHVRLGAAEIHPEHQCRIGFDLVGDGAAPDRTLRLPAHPEPSAFLKCPHDLRRRLLRETGNP
jgi:hypothetical protein